MARSVGAFDKEVRIVMIGKTGTGKSVLGNNLLGKMKFPSKSSAESVTVKCDFGEKVMNDGKKLVVVDTPGFLETKRTMEETRRELRRYVRLSSPGPHAIFFVLRVGRYTQEEIITIKYLKDMFGEQVFDRVIIIFTCKDVLGGRTIREFIEDAPPDIKELIDDCNHRCVFINNRAKGEELKADIEDIMDMVEETVRNNNNTHYTEEMYEEAEKALQEKMKKIEEEKNRKERELQKKIDQFSKKKMDICRKEVRIVMVGKTGTGKSVLGNNLLGKMKFPSKSSGESVTVKCDFGEKVMNDGKKLVVVDTPGLFDTSRSEEETKTELARCIGLSSPGPHAIFFVMKIGRFTEEEINTIKRLKDIFGEQIIDRVIIIFTGKDDLEYDGTKIREFTQNVPRYIKKLIDECNERYVVINNRAKGGELEADIEDIMNMVEDTVRNNKNTYYTEKMYDEAEKALQEKMKEMEEEKNREVRELQEKIAQLSKNEKDYDLKMKKMMIELKALKAVDARTQVREEVTKSDILYLALNFLGGSAFMAYLSYKLGFPVII